MLRYGKISDVPRIVIFNRLRDRDGLPAETQSGQIKRLPHQDSVLHVKKVAVAIGDVGSKRQKRLGFTSFERSRIDVSLRIFSRPLHEKEVLSIGQEVGIAIGEVLVILVGRSGVLGRTAAIGHPLQRTGNVRRKDDSALLVPVAAATVRGITERLHWSARSLDFSQLAIGKKAEVLSVCRPEGEDAVFGARQRLRLPRAEPLHEDGGLVLLRCTNAICCPSGDTTGAPDKTNAKSKPTGRSIWARTSFCAEVSRFAYIAASTTAAAANSHPRAFATARTFCRFLRCDTTTAGAPTWLPPAVIHCNCSFRSCAL